MDATHLTWQRFARHFLPAKTRRTGGLNFFRLAGLVLFAGLLAGNLSAQSAGTGSIEGRVLNVGNGRYIANAKVTVDGTNLEAITDDFGQFRISGVPAGEAKLTTSYTGLDSQTATVNVTAGQTLSHNVDLT